MSVGMGMPASTAQTLGMMSRVGHGCRRARLRQSPARPARRGLLPGDADARHGVPAPGVLHPDLQGPLGRDPHRPAPAGRPGSSPDAPGPGPIPDQRGPSIPTWRTTSWSVPRPTTWASSRRCGWERLLLPDLHALGDRLRRYTRLLGNPPAPRPPRGRRPSSLRASRPDHRHLLGCRSLRLIRLAQPGFIPLVPTPGPERGQAPPRGAPRRMRRALQCSHLDKSLRLFGRQRRCLARAPAGLSGPRPFSPSRRPPTRSSHSSVWRT